MCQLGRWGPKGVKLGVPTLTGEEKVFPLFFFSFFFSFFSCLLILFFFLPKSFFYLFPNLPFISFSFLFCFLKFCYYLNSQISLINFTKSFLPYLLVNFLLIYFNFLPYLNRIFSFSLSCIYLVFTSYLPSFSLCFCLFL